VHRSFFAALTCMFYFLQMHPSDAEGAIAIGTTGDMIKDGVAAGTTVNKPTKEEARAAALKDCQGFLPAKLAAKQCKVITTFTRQCVASAFDPKAGTPGAGLAIGPDKEGAEALALALCQASAGKDRLKYCVVMVASATTTSTGSSKGTICDTHD
jgi:hypothetical protein